MTETERFMAELYRGFVMVTPGGNERPFDMALRAALDEAGERLPEESDVDWRERQMKAVDRIFAEIDEGDAA